MFHSRKVSLYLDLLIIYDPFNDTVIKKNHIECPEFDAYWLIDSETVVTHNNNFEGKRPLYHKILFVFPFPHVTQTFNYSLTKKSCFGRNFFVTEKFFFYISSLNRVVAVGMSEFLGFSAKRQITPD